MPRQPATIQTPHTNTQMNLVNLKRSEWECYTDTPDSIIETINAFFSDILKCESDPVEAQRRAYAFNELYSEWGFYDSECNQVTTNVINKYYKTNLDRWECFKAGWAAS